MTVSELQHYYRQLSDQLGREANAVRHGFGIGKDAEEDASVDALRTRWNEVRNELRRLQSSGE